MARGRDSKSNKDKAEMPAAKDFSSDRILPIDIVKEMRESYLDYSMSVIVGRALPDVRDGLKPVHRRILFSMNELGLTATSRFRKSATVVGDVLGKYHPHGDAACYDAMVRMAQDFAMRYPLVSGQGNFGCFTKDTKIRLADGRNLSFEDLIREDQAGKTNYTFTMTALGQVAIAPIRKPRLTRQQAEIMTVILDNEAEIKCTPDHRFLLKNGEYQEAQNLQPGVSLMPFYSRLSTAEDSSIKEMAGYEMVFQPLLAQWDFIHRLADDYNLQTGKYLPSAGRVRHHLDFNKLNNNPDNIQRMSWEEHWCLHSELAGARHSSDPDYVQKLAIGRQAFWNKSVNRQAYAERMAKLNKANWQDPKYRAKMQEFLSQVNKDYIAAHPEKRAELSERATKTLKRLWQEPGYRQFIHEKIIKGNKNHLSNKTGKVKFDAVCRHLLASGEPLTETTYDKARLDIYPNNKGATSWQTGLRKYYLGQIDQVRAELRGNHQVKKLIFGGEHEDVYDLTIDVTHNFSLAAGVFVHNSIDGDSAAAMRYTEAKMARLSGELLRDIDKETVDFVPNYDGSRQEPTVFPSAIPNLLLNGAMGIAVGMATKIPPHNLGELLDALQHLADHPEATTEDLLEFVKGPDFPTGGLVFNVGDIRHAYSTGKGGVVTRGEAEIVENKAGNFQIIISSIPYQVNKSELIITIADLVRDKKLEGVRDIRDESTKEIRVVIDLKVGAQPQKVLNTIYKHSDLETTFNYNMLTLVDGVPRLLSLRSILEEFLAHRQVIVTRRTKFDLRKAEERAHILEGLKKALDHIDEIIKLIKKSKDTEAARLNLMKEFKFSELQAVAILEMRLQKLAGLERQKIEDELKEKLTLIKELKAILADPKRVLAIIKQEFTEINEKYRDARRTKVIKGGVKEINEEDLVPEKEDVLVLTAGGYIKRTDPSEYRSQKRGGVGVIDLNMKEEDFVTNLITANTHDDLLFFTNRGKAYQIKMYDVPEGKKATRGKSIMNFLALTDDEQVTSILPMPKEFKQQKFSLMMVTKNGVAKKVAVDSFKDVRRNGIIAIKLEAGDLLLSVCRVEKGDQLLLASQSGQSIRFKEADVREMGRAAGGVRAMKLKKGDSIIGAERILAELKDGFFLVMSSTGYGKKTALKEFKIQKRGGSGIKAANVTKKTGNLMVAKVLDGSQQEIVAISKQGQIIRTTLDEIPGIGRSTQGVRIMKLREGDSIASLTCL